MSGPGTNPAVEATFRIPPLVPRQHPGQKQLRQVREGAEIDLNHPQLGGDVRLGEPASEPVAGVVAEVADLETRRLDAARDLGWRARVGEVRRDHARTHPVAGRELGRERAQPVPAPRHQHEVVPVLREQLGQLEPDPARRPRNEGRPAAHGPGARGGSACTASSASREWRVTWSCDE
jgi:hypothetical protein